MLEVLAVPAGTGQVDVAFLPALLSGSASSGPSVRNVSAGQGQARGLQPLGTAQQRGRGAKQPTCSSQLLCLENFVRLDNPNTWAAFRSRHHSVPGMRAPDAGGRFHPRAAPLAQPRPLRGCSEVAPEPVGAAAPLGSRLLPNSASIPVSPRTSRAQGPMQGGGAGS